MWETVGNLLEFYGRNVWENAKELRTGLWKKVIFPRSCGWLFRRWLEVFLEGVSPSVCPNVRTVGGAG